MLQREFCSYNPVYLVHLVCLVYLVSCIFVISSGARRFVIASGAGQSHSNTVVSTQPSVGKNAG